MSDITTLQYPIGKFDYNATVSDQQIGELIAQIESLPARLSEALAPLNTAQLNTPYRPGGWTVRQVVHHLADSHMNAYIRLNLMLTEEQPTIKPYKENLWAELAYKKNLDVKTILQLLGLIHQLLVSLLQSVKAEDYERSYIHPEYQRIYSLRQVVALYAWHGNHHLAHITHLAERNFDL